MNKYLEVSLIKSEYIIYKLIINRWSVSFMPASVAQLDARPTGDRRSRVRPPSRPAHSFVEIDHEIISTVILTLHWFKKGSYQFLAKERAQHWLTA